MNNKTKRLITGIAALAAVPAASLATAGSASAAESATTAAGTPDNHVYNIMNWPHDGFVRWNDYKDSDHGYDLDDLWLTDKKNDGFSVSLTVYRNGKHYKSAHAYNGETKKLYLWNVKKGEKVFWTACSWNNGVKGDCENHWSRE